MKATFASALLLISFFFSTTAEAQKKPGSIQRCATMNRLQLYMENSIATRAANEAKARRAPVGRNASGFRLQADITIPVVVHIVLPNPYVVTDADVQGQIDRLNQDFGGTNADSTNAVNFYGVRGRSRIRFCLARRTPEGLPTNGIQRKASATGSDVTQMQDPIKRSAQGGIDSWNPSQYLNIWVGKDATGDGILGYADNIGPGTNINDGIFLNIESFGSSACYTLSQYNKGRTATHEIGHYFGLYHIWGDDESNGPTGACEGDDFAQLPASTNCTLPAGLFNPSGLGNGATDVGDTPNQAGASGSCLTGTVTDACAVTGSGKMYQNHMDYTQDACLSMFTAKQVSRMEWILDNCRPGLKTSPGCQAPSGAALLDVAPLASVNPGGFELLGCQPLYYADSLSCPGSISPKFRVVNNGLTTITTLTVGYSFNNGPAVTQTVSVSIPQGGTYVASFPSITIGTGSHSFRFFTANPNGQADAVPTNDNYLQDLTVMLPLTSPFTEGFEQALPLPGWAIDNPDFDFTWIRTAPGRKGSAGKLSIDNYSNDGYRNRDDLRSASVVVEPASSYVLSFDYAHKNYPDPTYYDSLSVLVSTDCGQTFTRLFYKGGPALATAGSSDQSFEVPGANDWRTESITLSGTLLSAGKILVVFRNTSGYGNWLHLDNINLVKLGTRDLRLSAINAPGSNACSANVIPSVTVENTGSEQVISFSVGYRIDNGPLLQQSFTQPIAPGASTTVSLPQNTTTSGPHLLTVFSFDPATVSGTGDTRLNNDTLQLAFTVVQLDPTPVTEGFETSFPPARWTIDNPGNDITWVRKAPGRNSTFSAFFDNFNNTSIGSSDDIRTPFFNVNGADSVVVQFDVAHKFYIDAFGSANDRLSVLATSDCGNNFTTVYSKEGPALATAGSSAGDYTTPAPGDWRRERIVLKGSLLSPGSLGLAFRNTSDFGNNIFIDNISISAVYKRDLQPVAVRQPKGLLCASTTVPSITVRNNGTETVTAFTVAYSGTAVSRSFTGLQLESGAEMTVDLLAINGLFPGSYSYKVNTSAVVTAMGTGDLNITNDTLRIDFSVPGNIAAPFTESFTSGVVPPQDWSLINPDQSTTWRFSNLGNGNAGSAKMTTFNNATTGQKDDLVTPVVNLGIADSASLSFDVAAGNASVNSIDTLEILVTKDCGNSFNTVYKKWGTALSTVTANVPQGTEFLPQDSKDWRREKVDLSPFLNQSPVAVFFRATNNRGNNIFLDNINVTTRVLPARLKENGFLVFPAPFTSRFTVWHLQTPTTLQQIRVVNAAGQVMLTRQFTGNADKQEVMDLSGKAAGLYIVELAYSDDRKNVSQKVIKL